MTRPVQQRRTFIKKSAALSAAAAAGSLGFPAIVRGQSGPLKVGILHPVTGPLSYSGQLCRLGARIAVDEINAAGGIKSLGGAKIEAVYGDAQSKPEVGVAEVEKMNEAAARRSSAPTRARSASPPPRRPRSTTSRTWSTSASPTRSSSAG